VGIIRFLIRLFGGLCSRELSALQRELRAADVERRRLCYALEIISRVDAHRQWLRAEIQSPTPKKLADEALTGYKTFPQKRWEWQGDAICRWKDRAEALELMIEEYRFHGTLRGIDAEKLLQEKERIVARFKQTEAEDFKRAGVRHVSELLQDQE
jgi:hypothetical protein